MLFGKKQRKTDISPSFIQEKLSVSAVECFFQRCADDVYDNKNNNADWQIYVLQSGRSIKYLTSSTNNNRLVEYLYLLAQTAPYHIKNCLSFPLKYMAYIVNGIDGKLVPWCNNAKLLSAFIQYGYRNGVIFLSHSDKGEITVGLCPSLIPVTHNEGVHISKGDFFDPMREVTEYSPELITAIKAIDSRFLYGSDALDIITNNYSAWRKLATEEQQAACVGRILDNYS